MPTFKPFDMERMMSKWENEVEINLSESGVHPATVREFVDDEAAIEELWTAELGYPQANGITKLREHIAALYPGASPDNVLVTVGCAEANYNAIHTLLAPGDEAVVMLPNYMQIWGVAYNLGVQVKPFHLKEELGWAPDLDELNDAVTDQTKLIAVCNPNNPTGYILTEAEMGAIAGAAERVGAWLLADEVYSGAERLTDTPHSVLLGPDRPSARHGQPEQGLRPARPSHRLGSSGRRISSMRSGLVTNTRRSAPPFSATTSQ